MAFCLNYYFANLNSPKQFDLFFVEFFFNFFKQDVTPRQNFVYQ